MTATTTPIGAEYRPFVDLDQYPLYRRARHEEPVFFSPALGAWVVTRYDDVREVLGNPKAYSLATVPDSLARLSDEAYTELARTFSEVPVAIREDAVDEARKRVRTPILQAFSPEVVASMGPFIAEQVGGLVDAFAGAGRTGRADLMAQFARQVPVRVKAPVLGIDEADVDAFVTGTFDFMELHSVAAQLPVERQVEKARAVVRYQLLLDAHARRRRAEPRDDLFSRLVTALAPGGPGQELSVAQRKVLVDAMTGLIAAGHFTSTAMIGTGVYHLLRHRDQWRLLCERPELLDTAIEELARYDMPLRGLMRRTTKPVTLAGLDLPPRTELMVVYQSANRDETVFERPDELDITRAPGEHLGYGHGSRSCVGAPLGRAMFRECLAQLTRRLPDLRLAPGAEVRFMPGLHVIPTAIPVVW
ncbi:cytochrome P450 [Dactylosporangium sp. AC04546]|uniref:cytochrome P450 n=1 Tax=Dactylosporangium sp. AC04546 TaxID=2862460 RepID=UPI001EDDC9A7|nr:cytochrome P450 [Dactylosporangium sp. AC04546]WVK79074.1 cytochrome P450 [Dactylosporangium sp. AC04546]